MKQLPTGPAAAAILIAVLYLALGIAYALRTPIWQAPDEPAHFNYIWHLATGRGFPVLEMGEYDQGYLARLTSERFPPELPVDKLGYESHQPPLYYVLLAPVAAAYETSPHARRLAVLRVISLTAGLALLGLTWAIGRALFPEEPTLALGMVAFVALLPQHLAISASVNNDLLAEVLVAGVLLGSLSLMRKDLTQSTSRSATPLPFASLEGRRWWVGPFALGLALGAAFLTKTTAYAAAALPGLAALLKVQVKEAPSPARARISSPGTTLATIYGVGLAIGAFWWLRNVAVYSGHDVLGLARHAEVVAGQPRVEVWTVSQIRDATTAMFQSFWVQLGWMAVPAEPGVYHVLAAISGAAAAGAGVAVWRALRAPGSQRNALLLCLALLALVTVQTTAYNLQFLQPQGRYLFPALVPIAALVALGLREIAGPRWYGAALAALIAGLVALNLYAQIVLMPLL